MLSLDLVMLQHHATVKKQEVWYRLCVREGGREIPGSGRWRNCCSWYSYLNKNSIGVSLCNGVYISEIAEQKTPSQSFQLFLNREAWCQRKVQGIYTGYVREES